MWNGGAENGSMRGMYPLLGHGNFQSPNKPPSVPNFASHMSQPIRVGTIGSHVGQANHMEAGGQSLGHGGMGGYRLPPHPHSLPEFSKGAMNVGQFGTPVSGGSGSNAGVMRAREGRDSMDGGSRLQRTTSGMTSFGDTSVLENASGGACGVGHCRRRFGDLGRSELGAMWKVAWGREWRSDKGLFCKLGFYWMWCRC